MFVWLYLVLIVVWVIRGIGLVGCVCFFVGLLRALCFFVGSLTWLAWKGSYSISQGWCLAIGPEGSPWHGQQVSSAYRASFPGDRSQGVNLSEISNREFPSEGSQGKAPTTTVSGKSVVRDAFCFPKKGALEIPLCSLRFGVGARCMCFVFFFKHKPDLYRKERSPPPSCWSLTGGSKSASIAR